MCMCIHSTYTHPPRSTPEEAFVCKPPQVFPVSWVFSHVSCPWVDAVHFPGLLHPESPSWLEIRFAFDAWYTCTQNSYCCNNALGKLSSDSLWSAIFGVYVSGLDLSFAAKPGFSEIRKNISYLFPVGVFPLIFERWSYILPIGGF